MALKSQSVDPRSGANIIKGLLDIATVVSEACKGINSVPRYVAYAGSGIFQDLYDGIDNLRGTDQWAEYQLDKDIKQVEDYLSCMMTALINEAVYDLEQYDDSTSMRTTNANTPQLH